MRILITGGEGRLARVLAPILEARGHQVGAPGREELDITLRSAVDRALLVQRPDLVIQTAAWTDVDGAETAPERARAVNVDGAEAVAEACARSSIGLWHLSTDFVFDGPPGTVHREGDPTSPAGVYARTKREGEVRVLERHPSSLVVRTAWLYGGSEPDFVSRVLERARRGEELRIVSDQHGSPTWVVDLAGALADLLELAGEARGILHVANAGGCSRLEEARAAVEAAGIEARIESIASGDLPPGGAPRPTCSVLDSTCFARLTGRAMRCWRAALEEAVGGTTGPSGKRW